MKKNKYILGTLALLLGMASCTDYTEHDPYAVLILSQMANLCIAQENFLVRIGAMIPSSIVMTVPLIPIISPFFGRADLART